jgi:hypothetical protein
MSFLNHYRPLVLLQPIRATSVSQLAYDRTHATSTTSIDPRAHDSGGDRARGQCHARAGAAGRFFQADGDLLMVYPFAAANRVIYMTDRSELPVDSWMGKSDGQWDGEVLMVTTKWQNGQSRLDRAGNHVSNQLTVTERFRYEATLDDPQTCAKTILRRSA